MRTDQRNRVLPAILGLAINLMSSGLSSAVDRPSDENTDKPSRANRNKNEESIVTWAYPKELPVWIETYRQQSTAQQNHEASLLQIVELDLREKPLRLFFAYLTETTGVPFSVNTPELDVIAVDLDTPITIKAKASIGEIAELILAPLHLTFVVRESGLEVTSRDAADANPIVSCYDLRLILSSNSEAKQLIKAVIKSVDPNSWLKNGGTSSINRVGHVLIVSAPITTHRQIKTLLAQLSEFRDMDKNDEGELALKDSIQRIG